jgi:hypothetical protein
MSKKAEWRLFWALVILMLLCSATMLYAVVTDRFPFP